MSNTQWLRILAGLALLMGFVPWSTLGGAKSPILLIFSGSWVNGVVIIVAALGVLICTGKWGKSAVFFAIVGLYPTGSLLYQLATIPPSAIEPDGGFFGFGLRLLGWGFWTALGVQLALVGLAIWGNYGQSKIVGE